MLDNELIKDGMISRITNFKKGTSTKDNFENVSSALERMNNVEKEQIDIKTLKTIEEIVEALNTIKKDLTEKDVSHNIALDVVLTLHGKIEDIKNEDLKIELENLIKIILEERVKPVEKRDFEKIDIALDSALNKFNTYEDKVHRNNYAKEIETKYKSNGDRPYATLKNRNDVFADELIIDTELLKELGKMGYHTISESEIDLMDGFLIESELERGLSFIKNKYGEEELDSIISRLIRKEIKEEPVEIKIEEETDEIELKPANIIEEANEENKFDDNDEPDIKNDSEELESEKYQDNNIDENKKTNRFARFFNKMIEKFKNGINSIKNEYQDIIEPEENNKDDLEKKNPTEVIPQEITEIKNNNEEIKDTIENIPEEVEKDAVVEEPKKDYNGVLEILYHHGRMNEILDDYETVAAAIERIKKAPKIEIDPNMILSCEIISKKYQQLINCMNNNAAKEMLPAKLLFEIKEEISEMNDQELKNILLKNISYIIDEKIKPANERDYNSIIDKVQASINLVNTYEDKIHRKNRTEEIKAKYKNGEAGPYEFESDRQIALENSLANNIALLEIFNEFGYTNIPKEEIGKMDVFQIESLVQHEIKKIVTNYGSEEIYAIIRRISRTK